MLDLNNLKDITDGDSELLDELLQTFIQTTREDMLNLKTAVNNRQNPLIADAAHRIKGGAAIVGANQLFSMADDMEQMGNTGTNQRYDSLLEAMQSNFNSIEQLYPSF